MEDYDIYAFDLIVMGLGRSYVYKLDFEMKQVAEVEFPTVRQSMFAAIDLSYRSCMKILTRYKL